MSQAKSTGPLLQRHSLKSTFLVSKGLLRLYDKQNNTWLIVDMKFFFSCSTRHLTRELSSKRSKGDSISTRTHVIILYVLFKFLRDKIHKTNTERYFGLEITSSNIFALLYLCQAKLSFPLFSFPLHRGKKKKRKPDAFSRSGSPHGKNKNKKRNGVGFRIKTFWILDF